VAITPNGAFAYVANANSNSVSVIDTASNTVTDTVAVGIIPEGIAITPNGTFAYVTNDISNTVSVINTASNAVVATVAVGIAPRAVSITPGASAFPTDKNQCKEGGWRNFTNPSFGNQGECVCFVESHSPRH